MKKDDLNKKQRYALDTMLSGSNVFLTGDAGTGKTTVIQTFIDEAEKAGKSVLVSATTGIAADNIGYGATTVHRALNISIKFEDYKKKVKSRAELLKEADILIIDEISMCRFDLFNMIAKTIITENEERAVDRLLSGEDLILNIGAKVMITVNDLSGNYVNGTIGIILKIVDNGEFEESYLVIKTDKGKTVNLYRYSKDIEKQVIEETEQEKDGQKIVKEKIVRKKAGSFSQFPVKLAWAISIHKSQGQTFEKINIDPCCWDPGQFYVAVSRAKSANGIHFIRPIKQSYIKAFSKDNERLLEQSFEVEKGV